MTDKIDLELGDSLADLRMSPKAEEGRGMAPPPRRKSFSKLRRRLSQTFRFSFNGSLSEFPHSFVIKEEPDRERTNGNNGKYISCGFRRGNEFEEITCLLSNYKSKFNNLPRVTKL